MLTLQDLPVAVENLQESVQGLRSRLLSTKRKSRQAAIRLAEAGESVSAEVTTGVAYWITTFAEKVKLAGFEVVTHTAPSTGSIVAQLRINGTSVGTVTLTGKHGRLDLNQNVEPGSVVEVVFTTLDNATGLEVRVWFS